MIETRVAMNGAILFFIVSQLISAHDIRHLALKFSSTGHILMRPDMSPLRDALTICSWVKRMSNHHSSEQYWLTYVASANVDEIVISDTAYSWMFQDLTSYSQPTRTTNTWHQICLTWGYATKTKNVYYDGEQIGTEGTGERKLNSPGSLMLGQLHKGHDGGLIRSGYHFGGELYDTNIWSFQMTSSQVQQVFSKGLCSNFSLNFKDNSFLSWEDILLKDRQGGVTEIELEECDTTHHHPEEIKETEGYTTYTFGSTYTFRTTEPQDQGGKKDKKDDDDEGPTEVTENTFTMTLASSEAQKETTVDCKGDKITLNLAASGTFEKIHLLEKGCEFTGDESRNIEIGVYECGTLVQFNETHVIYSNKVTAFKSHEGSVITRDNILTVDFLCAYNRTGTTDQISWEIPGLTVAERVQGSGYLTFLLEIFETDNFSSKIPSSDYPVDMELQDIVYLQVQVNSTDPNLSLRVLHLLAKDTSNRSSGTSYYLIKNGCNKDSTLKQITTDKKSGQAVNSKHKRYAFETFNFLHNQTAVYVHAVVKVCQKDDRSCDDLCEEEDEASERNKKRRAVDYQEEYHLYQGPLIRSTGDQSDGFGLSGVEAGTEMKFTVLTVAVFLSFCN